MFKNILITGSAGFIGFHLCQKLLENEYSVIGIDNMNNYYDVALKKRRLDILNNFKNEKKAKWEFIKTDLTAQDKLLEIFKTFNPDIVVNLAAQAGVRYSIENPKAYINSNIVGFQNILDYCKAFKIKHFLYASSSSVYGGNRKTPFSENNSVNHPVSIYAATKRANELIAHTYSHLYQIPTTGMRFFTVYGPWGRPDMAPMIFADAIKNNKPIEIFNYGKMWRSFTYIDDVIQIIEKLIEKPALPDENFDNLNPNPSTSWCPYRIFNVGNNNKINIEDFLLILEKELNKKAIRKYKEMQPGDVIETLSDNKLVRSWIGNTNETSLENGIKSFIDWYKKFYN